MDVLGIAEPGCRFNETDQLVKGGLFTVLEIAESGYRVNEFDMLDKVVRIPNVISCEF